MSAAPLMFGVMATLLWLLARRWRDPLVRAYGLFLMILLLFASNKEAYGIGSSLTESTFSPLSLLRWALLGWFVWQAWRQPQPEGFQVSLPIASMAILLLIVMLLSGLYAEDRGYSWMRALSFAMLAFALVRGLAPHLSRSLHCLTFFRFHYAVAWVSLAPFLLLHLLGGGYGVTIIMGQYAGFFGNQNAIGAVSALLIPFVLFHWQVLAERRWHRIADLFLLGILMAGVWLSGSRNGTASTLLAILTYFFIVNLQSRLKIVAAGVVILLLFGIFPTLQSDVTRFLRKGTDRTVEIRDFRSQVTEERRYEMWTGVWPKFWAQSLTGYGFAQSHLLVYEFTEDREAGRSLHNSYLETFGDLGLPGISLLGLLLAFVGGQSLGVVTRTTQLLERQMAAVFIAIFVAGSFNAFFESWMFSVGNLLSLLYWSGVIGIVAQTSWRRRLEGGIGGGWR
jgi:hypothetical protein